MENCTFQLDSKTGFWQCSKSNWTFPSKVAISPRGTCPYCAAHYTPEQIAAQEAKQSRQQAEAIKAGAKLGWKPEHAKRWARALLHWTQAGCSTRTDEEVTAIVAICESCDKYKADEGRCSVCGCKVSTSGMAVFNKARMGSENCPKGKW